MLYRFLIFGKFKLESKLSVSKNRKIASRCRIASGVSGPLLDSHGQISNARHLRKVEQVKDEMTQGQWRYAHWVGLAPDS
jgi:hypothetical protein